MAGVASLQSDRSPSVKSRTIARLLRAARVEFAERGFASARVDDIARAAGVTKQLVYHYFSGKEELFAAVLDALANELMAELLEERFDQANPEEALKAFLNFIFNQYRSRPTLGALALEGMKFHKTHETPRNRFLELAPMLTERLGSILRRGAMSGQFRSDVDAGKFLAAVSLLMTGGFTNRYTVSAVAGFDPGAGEGLEEWRDFSIDLVRLALRPRCT